MRRLFLTILALLTARNACAALVTFDERIDRRPNAAERAAGVPAAMIVHDYYISTTADIVCIDNISFDSMPTFFQADGASDVKPPHPSIPAVLPAYGADSWITTPGNTGVVNGFAAAPRAWYDSEDSGPQSHFLFARLTSSALFTFNFSVVVVEPGGGGQSVAFSLGFPSNYAPPPLVGDFDGDLAVTGDDFLVWQRGQSPHGVGAEDLAAWQANFVDPPLASASSAAPELATARLAAIATLTLLLRGGRPQVHLPRAD